MTIMNRFNYWLHCVIADNETQYVVRAKISGVWCILYRYGAHIIIILYYTCTVHGVFHYSSILLDLFPPPRSAITFFHPLHSHSLAVTRVVLAIPGPTLELRILMINGDYDRQPSSVDNNIRSRNTQFHRLLRAVTTR